MFATGNLVHNLRLVKSWIFGRKPISTSRISNFKKEGHFETYYNIREP